MSDRVKVTIEDLVTRLQDAHDKMSAKNTHRSLLYQCGQVLIQQAALIIELRNELIDANGRLREQEKAVVLTDA